MDFESVGVKTTEFMALALSLKLQGSGFLSIQAFGLRAEARILPECFSWGTLRRSLLELGLGLG